MAVESDAAERGVLGCILVDPATLGDVADVVSPHDFASQDHAALYRLLVAMGRAGEPIDLVTVPERLYSTGMAHAVGGIAYVVSLPDDLPSPKAARHYAGMVRDAAVRRRLIEVASELRERATAGNLEVSDVLGRAVDALSRAQTGRATAHRIGDVMAGELDEMQRVYGGESEPGMTTGYPALDDDLGGGLRAGELTILAARPAMGKTAVALNVLVQAARHGFGSGLFSLEMRRQQLVRRVIPTLAGVPLPRVIDSRLMSHEDWSLVVDAAEAARDLPIWIDDTPALDVGTLAIRARAMVAQGCRVIAIDYLGKIRTEGRSNPSIEVGRNVQALKNMARELDVPVVCLAQLNRGVEARQDKRPTMADLRDSGEVEQEADSVLMIYRDAYYHPEQADPRDLEIIIDKARMGRVGTVRLRWDGPLQLVTDPSEII